MILFLTLLLFALVAINVPIAVSLGIVGIIGHIANTGELGFYDVPLKLFEGATNFPLIAIPLFVLAGALMNTTGISARLIDLAMALIGFVRGGLAMVNVAVSMFFAEISGSAVADVAATGSVMIPAMKRRGYTPAFAAAVTSSSASLAIIIPPSIPMILYAAFADVSVVQLFVAGIVPGVLGGFAMLCVCYLLARRYDLPREAAFDLSVLGRAFWAAKYALMLPVIILGGIFGGLVTATEGAGLAVLAACVIGFGIHRDLNVKQFYQALIDGIMQTGAVMLLVSTSALLGLYLTQSQVPQNFAEWAVASVQNKYMVLAMLNVLLLVLGVFLHGAGGDCAGRADSAAARPCSGDRPAALRADTHAQPRHWPADAAGGERPCNLLLHRQGGYGASHAREHSLHLHSAGGAADGHLPAGGAAFPGGVFLPMKKPRLAFVPGDANGIGPELTAKVLAAPPAAADILLIGDDAVIANGERITGKRINRRAISADEVADFACAEGEVAFLPYGEVVVEFRPGEVCAAAGEKSLAELSHAARLAQQGAVDGVCFAPLNKEAMKAGGMQAADELHHIAGILDYAGHISEINIMDSGVWTSRVTSHVALRQVAELINSEKIQRSAQLVARELQRAGIAQPKVAIAALNPHAGDGGNFGDEEITIIAPAVAALRDAGMDAVGPYPADTLFRRTAAEGIHGVVTMYHDQGQIALKLNGFERGVSVLGGLPVAIATPAHGTAFDIAGRNQTFTGATEAALHTLMHMAGGRATNGGGQQ